MNVNTGHLTYLEGVPAEMKPEYDIIPTGLRNDAYIALAGKSETYVDLGSDSKLAQFARKRRKVRNKIAKQSRRRNRR